jgi:RND family efflux transporter MFP subunit
MNRGSLVTGLLLGILLSGAAVGGWWLATAPRTPAASHEPLPAPAKVSKILNEGQLTTIQLRPEAVERLALRTAPIERKAIRPTRVYGGEVMTVPGHAITIAAPLSGMLQAPSAGVPRPGQTVKKRQVVLALAPLLSPEGRANLASAKIEAEGQVRSAQTQVDAARVAFERAERVYKSEAGSRKAVDEAQEKYDLARKAHEAAAARAGLLDRVAGEVEKGTAAPLPIESPEEGMLRTLNALPGQNVPSGAALFEVVDLKRIWVRVPVFVGDIAEIDAEGDATVGPLTGRPGEDGHKAKRATAPPSANAAAGTVDLFYELDNPGRHSPGERVGVTLPLKAPAESLTIAASAIVYDLHGGAWVYEQTGERTYSRRRVLVRGIQGTSAILDAGPAPGATIVVAGAAELFGAETGFTK